MTNRIDNYPALKAVIDLFNTFDQPYNYETRERAEDNWCVKLREAKVMDYEVAANEYRQMEADYSAYIAELNKLPEHAGNYKLSDFPYTRNIIDFLGISFELPNYENTGLYCAGSLAKQVWTVQAAARIDAALAAGATYAHPIAFSKDTRKPVRFARFKASDFQKQGMTYIANNGKHRIRFTSNWSTETANERLADQLEQSLLKAAA